jgi:hypothetical protein
LMRLRIVAALAQSEPACSSTIQNTNRSSHGNTPVPSAPTNARNRPAAAATTWLRQCRCRYSRIELPEQRSRFLRAPPARRPPVRGRWQSRNRRWPSQRKP